MKKYRAKMLLPILLFTIIIGVAGYVLEWSPIFAIKNYSYSISGPVDSNFEPNSFFNTGLNNSHIKIYSGEPMARINSGTVQKVIQKNSVVAKVQVKKQWFAKNLKILITLRTPVAQLKSNTFFDQSGQVFESPINYGKLPQVNLISSTFKIQNSQLQQLTAAAAKVIPNLPPIYLNHLISLQINSTSQIELKTNFKKPFLLITLGDSSDIPLKIQVSSKLLSLKENAHLSRIDVTNPLSPIVQN